jgi:class 3 adenylate cyclase
MQQVTDWLKKLGLGQYAQRFAENGINVAALPHLTDQDLKDIGVLLGHRRIMLAAIDKLADQVPATPVAGPAKELVAHPPPASTTETAAPEAAGERRHVTVMFCDLVDSTGIASKLDAEEWRDLVGAYLEAASAAVTDMGGKVAKKLGDGLMALFGYPVAQENDAERAVRAALAIQRSLTELNRKNEGTSKPALAARIAIDLGPVVVDASGEIFGDVPNIAARAQALAEPGAVVVTARVQRHVAGLFVAEERGSHELKGVPEPVTLYRIVRASGGGRRAGQRHLTPLVGRDEEIAMLMRRWERNPKPKLLAYLWKSAEFQSVGISPTLSSAPVIAPPRTRPVLAASFTLKDKMRRGPISERGRARAEAPLSPLHWFENPACGSSLAKRSIIVSLAKVAAGLIAGFARSAARRFSPKAKGLQDT